MAMVAILVGIFLALVLCFLPLLLSGKQPAAELERVRDRRLADAKMNARLLRMNL